MSCVHVHGNRGTVPVQPNFDYFLQVQYRVVLPRPRVPVWKPPKTQPVLLYDKGLRGVTCTVAALETNPVLVSHSSWWHKCYLTWPCISLEHKDIRMWSTILSYLNNARLKCCMMGIIAAGSWDFMILLWPSFHGKVIREASVYVFMPKPKCKLPARVGFFFFFFLGEEAQSSVETTGLIYG